MKQTSVTERLRYAFDNYMSKGTLALIGGLGLLSLIIIAIAGIVLSIGGLALAPEGSTAPLSFLEAAWEALMRTMDAGTMGGDAGWGYRIVMFLLPTLGGVFIISTLIGVLTSGVEGKLEELRKGRSRVIEHGQTVILGWSPQIFTIISELVAANENQKKSCVVILGDADKVEMEDELRDNAGDTKRTRIVCRTGSPISLVDLDIVSLQTSRSIIVLSPEKDDADADVIKTILAITNAPNRRPEPYHIVAEIRDPRNMEVARMVGKDEVELVLVGDLVARIIAQTCRQSGLSVVYTELLDFGGDEIYFKEEPLLDGKTFGETLAAYEDSTVMGLYPKGGQPSLNPPMDTRLQPGDQLIVIAEDDDTIHLSGLKEVKVKEQALVVRPVNQPAPERTLILGWNWRAPTIINELDNYVAPGSEVTVVANSPEAEAEIARNCDHLKNQAVTFQPGDTTDRRTLDALKIATFKHVIILCYSDTLEPQAADARTLITLLHLRDIQQKGGGHFSIVSEMLDLRNRQLAEVTQADDFIVSDKLISLMLAQVSENKHLNAVFTDIFDPEGSEIYLKLASDYVKLGEPVNFYTVVEAARRRNEIAIGYRIKAKATDAAQAYGVVVNPDKSQEVSFTAWDRIVVIAED
jgi:ion channel POLLUX/CASTOR